MGNQVILAPLGMAQFDRKDPSERLRQSRSTSIQQFSSEERKGEREREGTLNAVDAKSWKLD